MNINLKITYQDGTEKVVAAEGVDIVAFEEKFDLSMARLEQEVRLTHLFWLAWHVEKRNGEKAEFEKWLERVSIVAADDTKK